VTEQKGCLRNIQKFSQVLNKLIFAVRYPDIGDMHHLSSDWVRDRLPPPSKQKVTGLKPS
jgi:hypothetical protein